MIMWGFTKIVLTLCVGMFVISAYLITRIVLTEDLSLAASGFWHYFPYVVGGMCVLDAWLAVGVGFWFIRDIFRNGLF